MKIVIVGSSHAGICAGLRALEEYPEAEITLYDKRNQVSFVSQGIISYLAGVEFYSKEYYQRNK